MWSCHASPTALEPGPQLYQIICTRRERGIKVWKLHQHERDRRPVWNADLCRGPHSLIQGTRYHYVSWFQPLWPEETDCDNVTLANRRRDAYRNVILTNCGREVRIIVMPTNRRKEIFNKVAPANRRREACEICYVNQQEERRPRAHYNCQ